MNFTKSFVFAFNFREECVRQAKKRAGTISIQLIVNPITYVTFDPDFSVFSIYRKTGAC